MKTKNVLLTLWLAAPILVVVFLCFWIYVSLVRSPHMSPRAVGAGAGDTGGANALGEWLAGRDPDEVQRAKRDLREGRLSDPFAWPGGVELYFEGAEPTLRLVLLRGGLTESLPTLKFAQTGTGSGSLGLSVEELARTQSFFVAPEGSTLSFGGLKEGWVVHSSSGTRIEAFVIEPVHLERDKPQDEPIRIVVHPEG